jgi:hypothetical protein
MGVAIALVIMPSAGVPIALSFVAAAAAVGVTIASPSFRKVMPIQSAMHSASGKQ